MRGGGQGEPSIFDRINADDIVFAFFPCTRFEAQISMMFRGDGMQQKNWGDLRKLEYNLKLFDELVTNYKAVTKLAMICLKKNVRLVIENPANKPHFLTSYWCLKPSIIDNDRTLNGDYMKKPTQYWFVGFKPQNNLVFEPLEPVPLRKHEYMLCENGKKAKILRSEIHPQYASRFIRQYILEQ